MEDGGAFLLSVCLVCPDRVMTITVRLHHKQTQLVCFRPFCSVFDEINILRGEMKTDRQSVCWFCSLTLKVFGLCSHSVSYDEPLEESYACRSQLITELISLAVLSIG